MSATQWAVIGVSVLALAFAVVVGWLLWSSRLRQRGDSAEARYRRTYMDLHSTRNRRSMRGSRRNMWAAGSAGAVGAGYIGSGGFDHDGGGSDHVRRMWRRQVVAAADAEAAAVVVVAVAS